MRLLHCSDFHIGVNLNHVDRRVDHDRVFAQIRQIAIDEKVDVILMTGDLFHSASPAPDVLSYGWDVLVELSAIAPVVVLCGNHDSKKLFELIRKVRGDVDGQRICLVDPAYLRERLADSVIRLPSSDGERIIIGAVPFVRNSTYTADFFAEGSVERSVIGYADRLGKLEEHVSAWINRGYDNRTDIRIFAAHLMVSGAVVSNSDRIMDFEESYATRADDIPTVEYAAFGHVHKPQKVGRFGRYAGSPIPVDFGEKDDEKSVCVVSGKPGRPVEVQVFPLDIGRPLVRIKGTLEQLREEAAMYAGTIAKITVPLLGPVIDLDGQVRGLLPDTVICDVEPHYPPPAGAITLTDDPEAPEANLEEMFESYLETKAGYGDRERVGRYFGTLLRHVKTGEVEPPELVQLDEAFA